MTHRYLATAVGALITFLAVASWIAARRGVARLSPWWATVTLVWVCLQGAFGALTVTMKLYPAIVTLHLLGGIGLLVLLAVQARPVVPAPPVGLSRALRAGGLGGGAAGRRPDRPRGLGQHQLRGAGLPRFPDLPGGVVAGDGLQRLSALARAWGWTPTAAIFRSRR